MLGPAAVQKQMGHPTILSQNFFFFTANASCRRNAPCVRPTDFPRSWVPVAVADDAAAVAGCATGTGLQDVAAPSACACCYIAVATAALPSRPNS